MPAQQYKLALLALLAASALAQEPLHPARIYFADAYPPDSSVWLHNSSGLEYWGQADQPIQVNETYLRKLAGAPVELRFTRDGFEPATATVQSRYFWPDDPSLSGQPKDLSEVVQVNLTPTSAATRIGFWIRFNPGWAALWALVFSGLTWGLVRTWRRNTRLRALRASAERSDPMLANGPAQLGPYLAVRRLGMGGMATVYWAVPQRTLKDAEAVAIKVVQAQYADDPEFRKRFTRECKLASELVHPAIVRTLSSNTQEGLLYLVMELVEGQSLKSLIPAGGMDVERALKLIEPVLDGLTYAHQKGVVHRDLKPENIMVVKGDRPKIMDFGLAKRSDVTDVTRTGTALGTPAYLPPEQFLGADLDFRSDQYSMGISLYQILTGRVPFEGSDPMAVAFRHVNEVPPFPRELRPDLSKALEKVILRMICKDPTHRFADFTEVKRALQEARNNPQAFADWSYPQPAPRPVARPVKQEENGTETVAMETEGDDTIVGLRP